MVALLTGASSGIGHDMAKYLSNLGHDLILVARREDRLIDLKNTLKTKVLIISTDLSKKENIRALYDRVKNKKIDILINNAGFGLFGNFYETDIDSEMKMIDVNIRAVHYLTKLFLSNMIKRNTGYILNVASSAGFMAGPRLSTYYATKNYTLRLTEAIYEELRKNKINVSISCLCPGPTKTEFCKIAHGVFHVKEASSEYVAKYAIDKMFKHKLIIVPTIRMKIALFIKRFLPEKLMLTLTYAIEERKWMFFLK